MVTTAILSAVLLLAEVILCAYLYSSVHVAFASADALLMFALVPALALLACGSMLLSAVKDSLTSHQGLGATWVAGSLLGLFGLLLGVFVGPHLAAVFVWFLGAQVLLYLAASVSRKWKKRSVATRRDA